MKNYVKKGNVIWHKIVPRTGEITRKEKKGYVIGKFRVIGDENNYFEDYYVNKNDVEDIS